MGWRQRPEFVVKLLTQRKKSWSFGTTAAAQHQLPELRPFVFVILAQT